MMQSAPPTSSAILKGRLLSCLAWTIAGVGAAAVLNVFAFAREVGTPLIQSDAWFYLDGWLGQFLRGEMSWQGVFYQSASSNTNLPLQKLIVMSHATWMDLDFSIESTIGALAAICFCVLLLVEARQRPIGQSGLPESLFTAFLLLAILSLNSTIVYSWGLAALWFLSMLVALCFGAWFLRLSRSWWSIVLAAFAMGVLLDEVGLVVGFAASAALALKTPQHGIGETLRSSLAVFAGLALAMLLYSAISGDAVPPEAGRRLGVLTQPLALWRAVVVPISEAILHQNNHKMLFGAHAGLGAVALAAIALFLTTWFWGRLALSSWRREIGKAEMLAAFLMLVSYGMTAGILLQRVPVFGVEYLHQPRYFVFYALQLAALLMLAFARYARHPAFLIAGLPLFCVFAVLQGNLSARAWIDHKYVSTYIQSATFTLGRIEMDPTYPGPCSPLLSVCLYPPQQRAELIALLRDRQLNVWSPDLRARHRLYLRPDQLPP